MSNNPFTIQVFTKDFVRQGWIGDPVSVAGTVRFNASSSFSIRLRPGDDNNQFLSQPGSRITIDYRGQRIFSGRRTPMTGELDPNADIVYTFAGDWANLIDTLAWVRPGGLIAPTALSVQGANSPDFLGQAWLTSGQQGESNTVGEQIGHYLWPDGSAQWGNFFVQYAETAIKWIIYTNAVGRLKRPLDIVFGASGDSYAITGDQKRGGDIRAAGKLDDTIRFDTLEEVVQPMLEWANLGLRIVQTDGSKKLAVEVWEPKTWTQNLTWDSQILQGGDWSQSDVAATRVVVGGPGEDAERAFWSVNDATGLEDQYGYIVEVFRDATSATLNWPLTLELKYQVAKYYLLRGDTTYKTTFLNYLNDAGAKGLTDGFPRTGVSVELSETETFHFGGSDGIQLGDKVTVSNGSLQLTDRLREVDFSYTDEGFKVTPVVGVRTDDPDAELAKAVQGLASAVRRISSNR